jgi:hypothetical protein
MLIWTGAKLNMGGTRLDDHFIPFIQWCDQNSVPIVVAAGNVPQAFNLHEGTPQHLGTATNSIITVGAVKKDGTLWENTAVPESGKEGSMTTFAPGEDIGVPTVGGQVPDNVNMRSGTSHAAAITVSSQFSSQSSI